MIENIEIIRQKAAEALMAIGAVSLTGDDIKADTGRWERCDEEGKSRGNQNISYKLFTDYPAKLVATNFHTGEQRTVDLMANGEPVGKKLSPEEKAKREEDRKRQEEAEAARILELEKETRQFFSADGLPHVDKDHPYISSKKLAAEDVPELRQWPKSGDLCVPYFDKDGKLVTYQRIPKDCPGNKKFAYGSRLKGRGLASILDGKNPGQGPLVFCEGYITGASIRKATGFDVLPCGSACNLEDVVEAYKGIDRQCLVVGDSDERGRKAAKKAAASLGCPHIEPHFTEEQIEKYKAGHNGKEPTDANDLHQLAGLEEVKRQIEVVLRGVEKKIKGVVCFADIEEAPNEWIWRGVLALGNITLIGGKPGRGKSQLALKLAAHVTTGTPWPDDTPCPLGNVLIVTCEDSLERTIKPRLMAAGADVNRCFSLGVTSYQKDIKEIEKYVRKTESILLIVDPLLAYMGSVNFRDIGATRQVMDLLSGLAERCGLSIAMVAHLTKGGSGYFDPIDRLAGNSGIGQVARIAFFVTRDIENPQSNRRLFLCGKNNLAEDVNGFAFTIEGATIGSKNGPIDTCMAVWQPGTVDTPAKKALCFEETLDDLGDSSQPKSKSEFAKAFLLKALENGPVESAALYQAFKEQGSSKRTLERAKAELGIKHKTVTVDGKRHTQWFLPEEPSMPNPSYGGVGGVGEVGIPDDKVADDDKPIEDSTLPSMPTCQLYQNKELGRPENESTSNICPTGEDIPNEVTI